MKDTNLSFHIVIEDAKYVKVKDMLPTDLDGEGFFVQREHVV